MKSSHSRRGGFSLLEILVVLGIAALMGSLVLGGFSSFQGSQRRSNCQSNMVQIYRACRLYSNDNDSFPLFTRKIDTGPNKGPNDVKVGGLAMLWGTFDGGAAGGPVVRPPIDSSISYLKSSNALHCPADVDIQNGTSLTAIKDLGGGNLIVDPAYLSYQKPVRSDMGYPDGGELTYNDVRTKATSDLDYARQLRHRSIFGTNNPKEIEVNIPTPSDTVVTWCPFHRGLSAKPDNVLFY
ncbi:MAG: type II secretion system protein, partial [Cytophagaceae bacterium]